MNFKAPGQYQIRIMNVLNETNWVKTQKLSKGGVLSKALSLREHWSRYLGKKEVG